MVFYVLILFFRIVKIFVIARVLKNMKKKKIYNKVIYPNNDYYYQMEANIYY